MKTPESSIFFAPVDERTLPKAGGGAGETRKPTRAGTKGLESEQGDQLLYHAARLLKATFRGSDAVFRNGAVDFLVVMPETSEQQAEMALSRLKCGADHWNSDTDTGLELSFSYGIATHVSGGNSADVIERARRCMFLSSQQVNLVF
jgi:diguanylate cyclase (GGDEF)-like protein